MAEQTVEEPTSRRKFLAIVGVTGGASVVALATGGATIEEAPTRPAPPTVPARNATMRMVDDVQRALARPVEKRRWAMVIDARRCIGCHACSVACMAEHASPEGVSYRTVPEVESGTYPAVQRFFMPTNCMQCENAPCIDAANAVVAGAMGRRPDGIVTIDYSRMKGRPVHEAAAKACPYDRTLYFDNGRNWTDGTPAVQPYEKRPAREHGRAWDRADTEGSTRKCHFCIDRLEAGMLPACVATCPGQAMHFGDLADAHSLVSELTRANKTWQYENGVATSPRVIYVDESLEANPKKTCRSCHT